MSDLIALFLEKVHALDPGAMIIEALKPVLLELSEFFDAPLLVLLVPEINVRFPSAPEFHETHAKVTEHPVMSSQDLKLSSAYQRDPLS